ncbi:MAG TPA: hypothetical protein VHY33_15485 [Thermoanaerobaculia bacterium]|jgi:hypothetical protein|nr:hypothetical protein [Thermoanaerobaculia bacterium]
MHTLAFILLAAIAPQQGLTELRAMCRHDGKRMWGIELCGPTMIVDRQTRAVVSNQYGPAFVPKEIGIANTAVDIEGKHWTMVVGPLPEDAFARKMLLAHESFHNVQAKLGFPSTGPANTHLDSIEGRYWLQLELRALAKALRGDRQAVRDALAFRAKRRTLIAAAAKDERELEMHEGLAEYTGAAFAEPDIAKRTPHLIEKLRDAETTPTFVRSFAYASGPAWGTLIEMKRPRWTRAAKASDDLGNLAADAWHVAAAPDADARAAAYDGAQLLAAERERDARKQAMLREFRARFIDGAHLTLPLKHMSFEFDPNKSQPFEAFGTVYPTLTSRDDWGSVIVHKGGALIASDWMSIVIPAEPRDDYTLTLNDGWSIVPAARAGDVTLARN